MPLHSSLSDRLHLMSGVTRSDFERAVRDHDVELLGRFQQFNDDGEWHLPAGIRTENAEILNGDIPVPIRVYRPEGPIGRILVWVHGGGFVSGTLDWPESHMVSAELAARAGCTVVAVDYRLAPDWQYPAPIDDVALVVRTIKQVLKVPSDIPMTVGGASAGAAIAMAAALRNPDLVDLLLLAYPFVHFPVPALSADLEAQMAELPDILRFTPEDIEYMVAAYVGRVHGVPADALPGAAVLNAAPVVRIVVAEYDDLRPSGELLARQLAQAGVDADIRLEPGVLHGHLNRVPHAAGVDQSLGWFAAAIRSVGTRGKTDSAIATTS